MAKLQTPSTAADIQSSVERFQAEHLAKNPGARALIGTELAALIAAEQPAAPKPGTNYVLTPFATEDESAPNPVKVASPDGTIEDAVRVYNAIEQRKKNGVVRTVKQLKIERLAS